MDIRKASQTALQDSQLRKNLKHTLGTTLEHRSEALSEVDDWEQLRSYAHQVKMHTLGNLGTYLEQLEQQIQGWGGQVFWASSARQAVDYILELAQANEIRKVVKSKSMVGEEIHINAALERERIAPIETDLGEYIVQLAGQTPSHLIAPALHLSRQQVSELFAEAHGMDPDCDVEEITAAARRLLRADFLTARLGITGVNFAIAESGTIVVVENEGNARMSMSTPTIHVAVMGIEKLLPRVRDLPAFLKLLVRSATGQKISCYVNLVHGVRRPGELDGPTEFHLILLDNGRIDVLADEEMRQTLACIRCGACLNVCPVYQSIGGHAYGSIYQGPIGAILTPQLRNESPARQHPFASSLCGACHEACPVKIEIPQILLKLRETVQEQKNQRAGHLPFEQMSFRLWSQICSKQENYERFSRWFRRMDPTRLSRHFRLPVASSWLASRDLPEIPKRTFRELYRSESSS